MIKTKGKYKNESIDGILRKDKDHLLWCMKTCPTMLEPEVIDYLISKKGFKWNKEFERLNPEENPICLCGEEMHECLNKKSNRFFYTCPLQVYKDKIYQGGCYNNNYAYTISGYPNDSNRLLRKKKPVTKIVPWTKELYNQTNFITYDNDPQKLKEIHLETIKEIETKIEYEEKKIKRLLRR